MDENGEPIAESGSASKLPDVTGEVIENFISPIPEGEESLSPVKEETVEAESPDPQPVQNEEDQAPDLSKIEVKSVKIIDHDIL